MGFYISAPQSSLLLCSTGNLLSFLFWGSEALDRATDVCARGTSAESEGLMEDGVVGGFSTWTCPTLGARATADFHLSECCPNAVRESGPQTRALNWVKISKWQPRILCFSRVAQPCSPRWLTSITHRAHTHDKQNRRHHHVLYKKCNMINTCGR